MHDHTMTYVNFNGETKTKTINFNLTEAELTKLQKDYLHVGGIQKVMDDAIASGDTKQLLDFFELLVHRSYGIKSADGEEFDKSPELMRRFENQAYYSDLYMSFFLEEGAVGQAFIRAVMPAALIAKAEANVRGDGELAQKAAAAQAFKPDARTQFEQARANLKDHLPKVQERNATIDQQTQNQPPAQEEPVTQNIFAAAQTRQPDVIQVQETPLHEASQPVAEQPQEFAHGQAPSQFQPTAAQPTATDFRVPAEEPVEEQPQVMTRAEWLAQQEREQVIPRPQHEQTSPNGL